MEGRISQNIVIVRISKTKKTAPHGKNLKNRKKISDAKSVSEEGRFQTLSSLLASLESLSPAEKRTLFYEKTTKKKRLTPKINI